MHPDGYAPHGRPSKYAISNASLCSLNLILASHVIVFAKLVYARTLSVKATEPHVLVIITPIISAAGLATRVLLKPGRIHQALWAHHQAASTPTATEVPLFALLLSLYDVELTAQVLCFVYTACERS